MQLVTWRGYIPILSLSTQCRNGDGNNSVGRRAETCPGSCDTVCRDLACCIQSVIMDQRTGDGGLAVSAIWSLQSQPLQHG